MKSSSISIIELADASASLARVTADANFVDLATMAHLAIDLRYASSNNFMGMNLYGAFDRAFLHRIAADKLRCAVYLLQQTHPSYRLLVLDAARPRSAQAVMWQHVVGTEMQHFVANPSKGSVHNFGFAIDLTLIDLHGNELDMGTPFDAFDPLSQPELEAQFVQAGQLTESQLKNRQLLRQVMQDAGFKQLPLEWWHFDALPSALVREQYSMIE